MPRSNLSSPWLPEADFKDLGSTPMNATVTSVTTRAAVQARTVGDAGCRPIEANGELNP
jgi:hypothetical protein